MIGRMRQGYGLIDEEFVVRLGEAWCYRGHDAFVRYFVAFEGMPSHCQTGGTPIPLSFTGGVSACA